mmetsp:Transcript_1961/g.2983  ORF Transcript_1961/g.2983 Transcript_1961/m.2983 type:complete len:255 (-) Transcript_1961:1538-2302(-)
MSEGDGACFHVGQGRGSVSDLGNGRVVRRQQQRSGADGEVEGVVGGYGKGHLLSKRVLNHHLLSTGSANLAAHGRQRERDGRVGNEIQCKPHLAQAVVVEGYGAPGGGGHQGREHQLVCCRRVGRDGQNVRSKKPIPQHDYVKVSGFGGGVGKGDVHCNGLAQVCAQKDGGAVRGRVIHQHLNGVPQVVAVGGYKGDCAEEVAAPEAADPQLVLAFTPPPYCNRRLSTHHAQVRFNLVSALVLGNVGDPEGPSD